MQMEMERGGKLFFDLFVALVNHMVRSFLLMFLLLKSGQLIVLVGRMICSLRLGLALGSWSGVLRVN